MEGAGKSVPTESVPDISDIPDILDNDMFKDLDNTLDIKTEQEIVKSLNDKYGPGNLDPQTGVFTPVEVPATESDS